MRDQGKPIITSLLDTDKYKMGMQQVNLHQYPNTMARYRFKCRSKGMDLRPLIPAIREQAEMVGELRFQPSELRYLASEEHLTDDYIDYLSDFSVNPDDVRIGESDGQLDIQAIGPMLKTSPWELYLLPIISELWFRYTVPEIDYKDARKRLMAKILRMKTAGNLKGFGFADFGTRRRFSKEWHDEIVRILKNEIPEYFNGTSNYALAKEHGVAAIGTMAHEYLQVFQGLGHPLDAQKNALDTWAMEFRGSLGVALTDVIGMDTFCKELDPFLAKQFEGFRQDSGDVYEWGEKLITRLTELNVDPLTKTGVWSDGLNVDMMLAIHKHFQSRLKSSFGWGTNLTNDLGFAAPSNVMKLVEVNARPVAKLSDSPGKTMCEDTDYLAWLAASYGRKEEFIS